MDRRLHNNLTALAMSGAVLVVALVSASPLQTPEQATPVAGHPGAASALLATLERAGSPVESSAGAATDGAPADSLSGATNVRHIHRRIAMPYFTFLPRG